MLRCRRQSIWLQWEADHALVRADVLRIEQIFWNVLNNAVKFTPPGGTITVRSWNGPENRIFVRITDSGLGMTASELNKVFEAFAQGDHAESGGSHRFGGLGLGMAISHHLVHVHAGTIRAESTGRGAGSSFTIELPTIGRPVTGDSPLRGHDFEAGHQNAAETPRKAFRILLVEDHNQTRDTIEQLLVRRGHTVAPTSNMAEALQAANTSSFDLVISDLGLPDGDGNTLMAELRSRFGSSLPGMP